MNENYLKARALIIEAARVLEEDSPLHENIDTTIMSNTDQFEDVQHEHTRADLMLDIMEILTNGNAQYYETVITISADRDRAVIQCEPKEGQH